MNAASPGWTTNLVGAVQRGEGARDAGADAQGGRQVERVVPEDGVARRGAEVLHDEDGRPPALLDAEDADDARLSELLRDRLLVAEPRDLAGRRALRPQRLQDDRQPVAGAARPADDHVRPLMQDVVGVVPRQRRLG
ncbi:hypothetical protein WME91_46520 [Sorangium sp. So ce269]